MTVTETAENAVHIKGLFMGMERKAFEQAVKLSQEINITRVSAPLKKCVVYLAPETFKTAWLGNKAVYRTRNAMADGGELIVLFPGFLRFGEDMENDRIIRKYGYRGYGAVLKLMDEHPELKSNMSAAAHLVHGSSDGRFTIRYCTLPKYRDEILSVGYEWGDIEEYTALYKNPPDVYYIDNPALGLWQVDK
jgi:nickel-dependent lactate racemase